MTRFFGVLSWLSLCILPYQSMAFNQGSWPQCYPDATRAYQALTRNERQNPVININSASAAELTSLTGVGHATAEAIIAYREAHGSFGSVDELMYVKGIGAATINKNRHRLSVMTR